MTAHVRPRRKSAKRPSRGGRPDGFIALFSSLTAPRTRLLRRSSSFSRGKLTVVAAAVAVVGITVLHTSFASTASYSLWSSTTIKPAETATWDHQAVELGFKFKSDENGTITGVKFYKASINNGTHTGSLWTVTGTRLATATFTHETTSGWQTVRFTTPVSIQAGQVYVASYHTNVGYYSLTSNYFTGKGYGAGPLHALPSTSASRNGVSAYGASQFPTDYYADTNYFVDVMFSPAVAANPTPLVTSAPTTPPSTIAPQGGPVTLKDPAKKEIAMELVSSAENSSLNWKAQYAYIEDIHDGRGYTGGIIGFTSGTGDMLEVIQYYTSHKPGNILAKYIPALKRVNGTASHAGLGTNFVNDWKKAALDPSFQAAQDYERDRVYFNPAVNQAIADGLHALGQFIYYDAMVMHGPGNDPVSFGGIRATAMKKAKTPAQGGNEVTYLNAYLDARKAAMLTEAAHDDTSRVDTEQRKFLNEGNLNLNPPLSWSTYGDPYTIK